MGRMRGLEVVLRLVLGIGGIALLFVPERGAGLLGVPVPPEVFHVRLFGVTAFTLGTLYALAALDPVRYRPVVVLAAVMRVAAATLLATSVRANAVPPEYTAFLYVEGPVAVLHVVYALWILAPGASIRAPRPGLAG